MRKCCNYVDKHRHFQYTIFDPRSAVLETFTRVAVFATEKGASHTPRHAVVPRCVSVGDQLASWRWHTVEGRWRRRYLTTYEAACSQGTRMLFPEFGLQVIRLFQLRDCVWWVSSKKVF